MSDGKDERTYYLRTICMYMDLTKDTLLRLFKHLIKSESITEFLTGDDIRKALRDLFKDDILNKSEYNIVSSNWPEPEKFDIALLIRLIIGLCRNEILTPQLGWHRKPQPKDESLGADLLRLRNVRNKLIGHSACAAISTLEYIRLWEKMKAILVRVVAVFDVEAIDMLMKNMNEYKDLHFEAENEKIRRYLTELAKADEETKTLQNQVEELLKKSKGFKTYFKTTPERFVRYVKLLFDGGSTVLCGVLERELRSQDRELDSLIAENKDLLSNAIGQEYHLFLFGTVDYKSWDVDLLASVILLLFTNISVDNTKDIEEIQAARRNYAMHAISCLDADEFLEIWTDLIGSLTHLSLRIEEETKNHVETLIARYKKKCSTHDADEYLEQLRKTGVPVKTLKDVYDDNMYLLKQNLRQMKERGIKFRCKQAFEVKLTLSCEDEGKKSSAEDLLERNLEASLLNSNGRDGNNLLKMETDKFMASITSHPDVKSVGIKRCCIILSFQCSTIDGILHLLDYFDSQHFHNRVRNISNELAYLYEEAFLLQGYMTLESLSIIETEDCRENGTEEGISIPLECNSVEGMGHILDTLRSDKTSNTMNTIADKMSDKLQETVDISLYTDLLVFKDVFQEAGEDHSQLQFKYYQDKGAVLFMGKYGIAAQGLKSEDIQDDLAHDTSAVKNLERHSSSVNESLMEMLKIYGGNNELVTHKDDDKSMSLVQTEMAISRRKHTDLCSIDGGSAEYIDYNCDVCLTTANRCVKAYRYCVVCGHYLCISCLADHGTFRILQHHQTVSLDECKNMRIEYNERCPLHRSEIIKFYCRTHDQLCCFVCVTLNHRQCKVEPYPPERGFESRTTKIT